MERRIFLAFPASAVRFALHTAAFLALAVVGLVFAHGPGTFNAEDPRVRVESGRAFLYVTFVNKESKPVRIVGALSRWAERVELRRGAKAVSGFEVAARGRLKLAPGGRTAVLLKLTRSLNAGDLVPILLRLDDGDTFPVLARVVP